MKLQFLPSFLFEYSMMFFYPFAGVVNFFISHNQVVYPGSGRVIIIVERWLNRNTFHPHWYTYLQKKGFSVHQVYFPIYKDSFAQSARELKEYIERNLLDDVILVGISSGGITSLLYLQELDGWSRVRRFINVGTPFRGTIFSLPLWFIPACRELLPNSKCIQKLNEQKIVNKDRIVCINAVVDELVPKKSRELPGTKLEKVEIYGHNNVHLHAEKTYEIIANYAAK